MDIPNNAFDGCSNLCLVNMPSIVNIGDYAFKNCDIDSVFLSNAVEKIGQGSFENIKYFAVQTNKKNIVESVVNSGASNIALHTATEANELDGIKINVESGTETFAFYGYGSVFNNVSIVSDADKTVINRAVINANTGTPLKASSKEVYLEQVDITSPGFALTLNTLNADTCEVYLYGENTLKSSKGDTVLCKDVNLIKSENATKKGVYSELKSDGNVLYCIAHSGDDLVNFASGTYKKISEGDYNKYLNGVYKVTFDANGGSVAENSRDVYYGQAYGDLPVPEREHYGFAGWFTEKDGGTEITKDTIVSALVNQTLYAHWTPNAFTITFNANGGSVNLASKTLKYGDTVGQLPIPTRDYYTFDGWYEKDGTTPITSETLVTNADDITLYAHWKQIPASSWVMASEAPADAQIVNEKYSYTQRSYTTSSASSKSGWTMYDTKRTSWGGTQGPVYSNPSNGSRNVWSEQYISSYGTKHIWHFHKWGFSELDYSYPYSTGGRTEYHVYLDYYPSNSSQRPVSKDGSKFKWYASGTGEWAAVYFVNEYDETDYSKPNYSTRWYYQEPVYTYYYYQDTVKESTSDPTGQSNISNIVKWVQYRPKTVPAGFVKGNSTTYNGHTYSLYTSPSVVSWNDAKIFCEANGGYLAVITSAAENNVVKSLVSGNAWLGALRTPATSWVWVNGEAFSYADWSNAQPDCNQDKEFYLGTYTNNQWNDFPNNGINAVKAFVMESVG